ncbi:LuxR C-terminal-related transcriptional regulator [Saccharothrix sp.]|uniref:LuxR C-terminal-related transcriptional regulator n=1 Tax=Saccharothrix sp. TaxID=1873460 RepID=UPI002811555B|nr:LuxR C-terminal-related transcriptional regulator [Saccharothrix sp.]
MSNSYGRDREWASVIRFLSAPGGLLAIDGPPCTGKSLLLRDAVDAARVRGYSAVLVHPGALGDLPPGPNPLVAIDQAHEDPAAVLAALPGLRAHGATTLVALTGAYAGPDLRRTLPAYGEVLTLKPVGDDVVAQVLKDVLGAEPEPGLAALVASAGGNPGLVVELITGLREENRLDVRDGVARLTGAGLPRRVAELVRAQADALSSEAAQVLRVAAVLGRSFLLKDVATMTGRPAGALLPAVDEVLASGLVVSAGVRLEFASDLGWQAVVQAIPPSVLHALRHDADLLRTDLREPPTAAPPEEQRGAAAVHDVRRLAAGGRLGAAIALARDSLAQRLHAGPAAELHTALAGILLADGRPADAVAEMEHALSVATAPEPLRRLAAAGRLLSLYFATGNRAGAHALSVLTARDREASDADVVMAACVHSCLEWNAGNLAEGLYWGRESTRWELDRPTAWWQSHAAVAFAMKLSSLGEFADAEKLVRGDGPDTDEAVTAGAPAARMIGRARVLFQAGKLVQAQVAAHSGLSLAHDRGLRLLVPLASAVLAVVALHRGDVEGAASHVRRYRGDLAGGEAVLHSGQYDWVELLVAEAQGGPERAAELARERLADLDSARRMLIEEPGAGAWLVRLALVVGDSRMAGVVVGAAEELAANNPGCVAVSVGAGHARALLDGDEQLLETAAGKHRHPWAQAWAHEDLAVLSGESGQEQRAREHAEVALRIFERMGASGDAARVRRRAGVVADEAEGSDEWGRLSSPERDIARLVGAGLTNRQVARQLFLSPHTVNYHLRGIFRKLGISSRVELARLAGEQEHAEV